MPTNEMVNLNYPAKQPSTWQDRETEELPFAERLFAFIKANKATIRL
jgi:hypothetical protein